MIFLRNAVSILLVELMILTPAAQGAKIPAQVQVPSISVLRSEELRRGHEGKALSLMERRVHRWLENRREPVRPVSESVRSQHQQAFLLERVLQKVRSQPSSALVHARAHRWAEGLGPETQELLLWASLEAWQSRKKSESVRLARDAMRLHPDLLVELGALSHHLNEIGALKEFQAWLLSIRESEKRSCQLEVAFSPAQASVTVNGFYLGARKRFQLPKGKAYSFRFLERGFETVEKSFQCREPGKWQWEIHLTPSENELPQLGQRTPSYLMVDAQDRVIQFFLFTPGVALDVIPVSEPLKIARVIADPLEEGVPIRTDSFNQLWRQHQRMSLRHLPQHGGMGGTLLLHQPSVPWYQDWKVWAIVGGITGGVLTTYFLTKKKDLGSQVGGIRVNFD